LDSGGKSTGSVVGIETDKGIVLEMDSPVRAFGQSFPQNLLRSLGTGRDNDYFPAVLLFLAQSFFQRVSIWLVHFVRNIFTNPGAGLVQLERRIFLRNLLHANQDLHYDSSS